MVQDHELSKQLPLSVSWNLSDIFDTKAHENFKKTDLDQTASLEASLDIFRWFIVGGEGLPPENIYQDDWLREIWEDDESGMDANEAADEDSQGLVGNIEDRLESRFNAIG